MQTTKRTLTIGLAMLIAALATPAWAALITYAPYDLSATEPNLWQIDYVVSDHNLGIDEGFQVFFPYGQYEDLALLSAATGWDALVFQPDMIFGVPEPGILDGLQLVDNGGAAAAFSIQLHWLGVGTPEPQNFELYDANFNVLESGRTVMVPEPVSGLLLVAGLCGLAWRRSR